MIDSYETFYKLYNPASIVNYDMEKYYGFGLTYKTGPNTLEKFRKYDGNYISFPSIQPYSKLTGNYNMFIIKDNKMYKLKIGSKDNTYSIDREIDIDLSIFDKFFNNENRIVNPANRADESICEIEVN